MAALPTYFFSSNTEVIVRKKLDPVTGNEKVYQYAKGRYLGKGGFAQVYEITDKQTGEKFALKIIQKSSLQKESKRIKLKSEIRIHRELSHKNIVKFIDVFEDKLHVYLLLELCENKSMMSLIRARKKVSEDEAKYFLKQLVDGLQYLRSQKVIHRDLKLGNLMLNAKHQIKIGDFGLSTKLAEDSERHYTICGTPNYIAPEILKKDNKNNGGHSYEVDIWSVGVILYTLLIGKPPFEAKDLKTTYKKIIDNVYAFPDDAPISADARCLIRQMLHPNPSKRIELNDILTSDFFRSRNVLQPTKESDLNKPQRNSIKKEKMVKDVYEDNSKAKQKEDNNDSDANLTGVNDCSSNQSAESALTTNEENMPSRNLISTFNQVTKKETINIKEEDGFFDKNMCPITKWVDYTSRYGLSYQLQNNATGVYFNDNTKIICDTVIVQYMPEELPAETFPISDEPLPQHAKKVSLLKYFMHYFESSFGLRANKDGKDQAPAQSTAMMKQDLMNISSTAPQLPFVTKWTKTKYAIIFCLSDGTTQANFFKDHTKLVMWADKLSLTYINKEKKCIRTSANSANLPNELKSRMKYTRNVLIHLNN